MDYLLINVVGLMVAFYFIFIFNSKYRDYQNHVNYFSVAWGSVILGSQIWFGVISPSPFFPRLFTIFVLFAAWWAFLIGSLISLSKRRMKRTHIAMLDVARVRWVLFILVVGNIIQTLIVIKMSNYGTEIFSSFGSFLNSLAAERILRSDEHLVYHFGWYVEIWHLSFIYYIPLAFYALKLNKIKLWELIIVFLIAAFTSFIPFSRSSFYMLLVVSGGAWFILYKPSFNSGFFLVVLLLLTVLITFFKTQRAINDNDSRSHKISEQIASYVVGSVPAYQLILDGDYGDYNPHNAYYSLQWMYYFFGKTGLIDPNDYPLAGRRFCYTPYMGNLYTYLDAFTLDAGWYGSIIGSFFMGLLFSLFYKSTMPTIDYFGVCGYLTIIYGCVMVPFANLFLLQDFFIRFFLIYLIGKIVKTKPTENVLLIVGKQRG